MGRARVSERQRTERGWEWEGRRAGWTREAWVGFHAILFRCYRGVTEV